MKRRESGTGTGFGMYARYIVLVSCIAAGMSAGWAAPAAARDGNAASDFHSPSSGDIGGAPSEMRGVVERFSADRRSLDRYFDFTFSPRRNARYRELYREWLDILDGIDFDGLGLDGRIDYLLLKNHIEVSRHRLEQEVEAAKESFPLLPFAENIFGLCGDLKRMKWIEGRDAADALNDLRRRIEDRQRTMERRLAEGEADEGSAGDACARLGVKSSAVPRALSMLASLRRGLENWYGFYDGYDPVFTWWAAEPYKAAVGTLSAYREFLEKRVAGIRPGEHFYALMDPVGRDALVRELAFEMLPYTPEEILAIGWQEYAWCEKERDKAAKELGFDTWQEAFEHVKGCCVDPGQQPELIRYMAFEAIDFLEEHDCVTIPPMVKDLIRMEMMPLERQKTTPFFTGGEVISVAYAHNSVAHEQKVSTMRGNNPHFSRAVVHHELVPGHNLQGFMGQRRRAYRRPFRTSFFGEGWPLYWEMRLWDMGFQKSPEDRIGMLFWRMHRCARIIFSISYHLGKMDADECIDLLVSGVGHEYDNAVVETKAHLSGRTSYGLNPLAQSSYMIGGLQIRALSRELVDSGKMTPRDFHDAVLRQGSIPVEMLRAKLIGQKLERDFRSMWKFYDLGDKTDK